MVQIGRKQDEIALLRLDLLDLLDKRVHAAGALKCQRTF